MACFWPTKIIFSLIPNNVLEKSEISDIRGRCEGRSVGRVISNRVKKEGRTERGRACPARIRRVAIARVVMDLAGGISSERRSLEEVHGSIAIPADRGAGRRLRRLFAFAGPAYLVSIGYMDPGNWATD